MQAHDLADRSEKPIEEIWKYHYFCVKVQKIIRQAPLDPMCLHNGQARFKDLQKKILDPNKHGCFLFSLDGCVRPYWNYDYVPLRLDLVVIVAWTGAFFSIFGIDKAHRGLQLQSPLIGGLVLFGAVLVFSMTLNLRVKDMLGKVYWLVVALFTAVCLSFFYSSHQDMGYTGAEDADHSLFDLSNLHPIMRNPNRHNDSYDLPRSWAGVERGTEDLSWYPLCGVPWGHANNPISALDIAALAYGVYEQNCSEPNCSVTKRYLRDSFPYRTVELVNATPYTDFPRWMHFRFFDEVGVATSVFAIKGTSRKEDLYFDASVYNTITLLRKVQQFLPVLQILPRSVIQWAMAHLVLPPTKWMEVESWDHITEIANDIMHDPRWANDAWVTTGHSLGGMFAQIVSARLKKPALVWSSPGIVFMKALLGIQVQDVMRDVVVVIPAHDAIPHVDYQAGMVQRIECRNRDGHECPDPMQCHDVRKSACEIWRVCGDPSRDYSKTCSQFVNQTFLGKDFPNDDIGSF